MSSNSKPSSSAAHTQSAFSAHSNESSSSSHEISSPYTLRPRNHSAELLQQLSRAVDYLDYFEVEDSDNESEERLENKYDEGDDSDSNDDGDSLPASQDDMEEERENEAINNNNQQVNESSSTNEQNGIQEVGDACAVCEWTPNATPIESPIRVPNHPPPLRHKHSESPLQLLQHFISDTIITRWAEYSNKYAHDIKHSTFTTTPAELYAFIGVHVFMGFVCLAETNH